MEARPLEANTIRRLCSGQVIISIETCIKELVENAVDAKCSYIDVLLVDCGLERIVITDNGSGISKNDHNSLGKRHYTNKLRKFEDLIEAQTMNFGFRGEALHSIATLSKSLSILTSSNESGLGFHLEWNNNIQKMNSIQAPRAKGTTVSVSGLFHNLPVRLREIKRNASKEIPRILHFLKSILFSHPYLGIYYSNNITTNKNNQQKQRLLFSIKSNSNRSLIEALEHIYGSDAKSDLIEIDFQSSITSDNQIEFFSFKGYISRPFGLMTLPNHEFYCIRKHPCNFPSLSKSIYQLYRLFNVSQRPFILLSLDLPTGQFDFNLSTDKKTVLIFNQSFIFNSLIEHINNIFKTSNTDNFSSKSLQIQQCSSTQTSLSEYNITTINNISTQDIILPNNIIDNKTQLSLPQDGMIDTFVPSDLMLCPNNEDITRKENIKKTINISQNNIDIPIGDNIDIPIYDNIDISTENIDIPTENMLHTNFKNSSKKNIDLVPTLMNEFNFFKAEITTILSKNDFLDMTVIGQFNCGFIITKLKRDLFEDLYILDQHACDEKYRYENLRRRINCSTTQTMLKPLRLQLSLADELKIMDLFDEFNKLGFSFIYDENATPSNRILWTARPCAMSVDITQKDIQEMLGFISQSPCVSLIGKFDSHCATKACRSSIMIGTPLSIREMNSIVKNLSELDQPWNCPHGRPTLRHLYRFNI